METWNYMINVFSINRAIWVLRILIKLLYFLKKYIFTLQFEMKDKFQFKLRFVGTTEHKSDS